MVEAEIVREATSSIELQRAKDGTYYWTIKRYWDASWGCQQALSDLNDIDAALREKYIGTGGKDVHND